MARSITKQHLLLSQNIFLLILLLWSILAFSSVFYNGVKGFIDEKQWLFLSEQQKREKIFGDVYLFFTFLNKNTPTSAHIILYPHTEELFYFGIYNLHPRKIATAKDNSELVALSKNPTYEYIATYNKKVSFDSFKEVASSSTSKNYWILYKRL